jgi:hypothetical protein
MTINSDLLEDKALNGEVSYTNQLSFVHPKTHLLYISSSYVLVFST